MLHDPSSYTPPLELTELKLTEEEKDILKKLGENIADIAALPFHKEKARLWTKMNDLDSERPMIWINEIPWHEMNVNDELTLQCSNPWARELEDRLRKEIYQWNHMPGDMVINNYIECPLAIHSTDFGIIEDVDIIKTDETSDIVSRHFNIQIKEPEDLKKIQMPTVTHNEFVTDLTFKIMEEIFRDIIEVKKVAQTHIWFTPWDYLVRWWGIQEAMIDLVMRPQMVHDGVERLVQAWMTELDQFEEQNLLSLDNRNIRVGSGGYGYISSLPGEDYDPEYVKPYNMWGCSNAQIFSEVSPEMHWEFAIEHDLKWLERWGVTYYGCCEPLDKKAHLLRRIPNLRKISISPWADLQRSVEEFGTDYVLSIKPSPAIFTGGDWKQDEGIKALQRIMNIAGKKCHIEIIMKDISTVSYKPQNLWAWEKAAMEIVQS